MWKAPIEECHFLINLEAYITHGNIIQEGMLTFSIVNIFWLLVEPIGVIKKIFCYLLRSELFKNDRKCFYLNLKTLFVLITFKFLSSLFGHVEKMAWLER